MDIAVVFLLVIIVVVATFLITKRFEKGETIDIIDRVSMALVIVRVIAKDISKDHYVDDIVEYIFDAFFYVESMFDATKEEKIAEGVMYVKDLLVSQEIAMTKEREDLILELFIIAYDIIDFFEN